MRISLFRFPVLYITLLGFAVCSCTARVPEPVNHEYSQQTKMQSSHHWEVLARDLADRINNQLILTDNIERPVYVKTTCGDESNACDELQTSSFNEAFRDLLITNMFQYGVPTNSEAGEDSLKVQYKVQIVRHNSDRIRTLQPGILTALSAAIVVLRDAPSNLLIFASGMLADATNSSLATKGKYEIIITTSMIDKGRYLFRASDIYYINDKDFLHYRDKIPTSSSIKLSSKKNSPPQSPWFTKSASSKTTMD